MVPAVAEVGTEYPLAKETTEEFGNFLGDSFGADLLLYVFRLTAVLRFYHGGHEEREGFIDVAWLNFPTSSSANITPRTR